MSQETKEQKQASLKDLNTRLKEIFNTIDDADSKLQFLAKNTPSDKAKDEPSSSGETATLEGLHVIVERIGRATNSIARSTNIIVGS